MYLLKIVFFILFFISSSIASNNLKKVSLQLNWKYQFEFAGFIAAKEKGFYKELGLDVDIKEFSDNINVIDDVKNEKVTFGVYDSSYLNLYDSKKPIVLLANYFKRPALVLITKQNIVIPSDLKGKKVMYAKNELSQSSIGTLLKRHKIKLGDFTTIEHDYTAKKFISGEVDAMTAFISNELYHIIESKVPYRIMDPQNYGITEGGLNLFTSLNQIKKDPQIITSFLKASKKGWQYALDNKEEIVDIIYNKYSQIKTKKALLSEANETQKLMMTNIYDIGEIIKNQVTQSIEKFALENGNDKKIPLDTLIFNYKKYMDTHINLTKKEKDYIIEKRKVTMCIDPDWMPYEKIVDGKHVGMTSEYIPMISDKIRLPITLVPTKNWVESLDYAKQRKCDILSLATATPSRLKYLKFTKPYISFPVVIATKTKQPFIAEPEKTISEKKLGIIKGYAINELFKEKYPNNKIIDVKNVDDGLQKLSSGEIFGFVGALPAVAYKIQHKFVGELKIAGKFNTTLDLSIGVRNDDETLYNLFEKAIEHISEGDKQQVLNKYISIKVEGGFDYELFYKILILLIFIAIFVLYRHQQLLKYNKSLQKKQLELNRSNEELKETKEKLEASIKDFKILIDSVIEGISVFENGICIDVNEIAIKMFEYKDKSECLGKHISEFVTKESYTKIQNRVIAGDTTTYELKGVKKNGELFDILVRGSNVMINSKEVRISAVIDVTEMKNKEQLLFQQSKMAAMGQMLENIAHQWRQPLSLISTISTGLEVKKEMELVTKEEELLDLKKINSTSQHLSQTIEDFRNFFKSNKVKSRFSLLTCIEKNLSLLEGMLKNNNIEVIYENKDDIELESYENEFTQALINIFYNSKDAMQLKKVNKYIFIDVKKLSKSVVIKITDSGGGIDEKIIKNIFEPYFTTKHKTQGTGIGLYMTHMIIEKHMNGSLEVRNDFFKYNGENIRGAQFIIELPI